MKKISCEDVKTGYNITLTNITFLSLLLQSLYIKQEINNFGKKEYLRKWF